MAARRSSAVAKFQPATRCAIYCRKSTSQGLEQEFNSLDAQREAAESYVASQRHENWVVIPDLYDDGGRSGATTDRPALRQLLADVETGKIDCIVVYKYDRLSRSMLDFLQLLDRFERHGVSFVSVSQRFDTSTPVGKMTMNILLSFAEFERHIIADRTRDKIQAARRRGRWTGGRPPLGYDAGDGKLVVGNAEADQVRAIFQLYVERPSLVEVAQELNRRGWRQKAWTAKTGRRCGGRPWNNASVRTVLKNPLYIGRQKLGDETFKGDHESIVTQKLFKEVQRLLTENRTTGGAGPRNRHGFLVRGLLRCSACDAAMVPTPTSKGTRLYRYYTCRAAQKNGHAICPTKSVNADKVENFIVDQIRHIGADPDLQDRTFRQAVSEVKARARGLRLEARRLKNDLGPAKADVERLVAAVSRCDGPAADAIAEELAAAQERLAQIKARQAEIKTELADLKAQSIERDDLVRALEAFDPIWGVLLTPERERVMQLLIERIDYDGENLAITWRLSGFGEFSAEVAP